MPLLIRSHHLSPDSDKQFSGVYDSDSVSFIKGTLRGLNRHLGDRHGPGYVDICHLDSRGDLVPITRTIQTCSERGCALVKGHDGECWFFCDHPACFGSPYSLDDPEDQNIYGSHPNRWHSGDHELIVLMRLIQRHGFPVARGHGHSAMKSARWVVATGSRSAWHFPGYAGDLPGSRFYSEERAAVIVDQRDLRLREYLLYASWEAARHRDELASERESL